MFECTICDISFSRSDNFQRHKKNFHAENSDYRSKCAKCNLYFTKAYLKSHKCYDKQVQPPRITTTTKSKKRKGEILDNVVDVKTQKKTAKNVVRETTIFCDVCKIDVRKRYYNAHLKTNGHKLLSSVLYQSNNIQVIKTAFKNRIKTFKIINLNKDELIFDEFFKIIKISIRTLIEEHVKLHTTVKVNIELFGLYELIKQDVIDSDIKSFNTKSEIINVSTDLNETMNTWFEIIKNKSEEFNEQNSGWSLLEILHVEININKFVPMRGSGILKLPKNIARKKAVVNVKSGDGKCFAYAILAALTKCKTTKHVYEYSDYMEQLNLNGIDFPMKFTNISKFEDQNDLSINVFGLNQSNTKIVGPLHHTKNRRENHINLLYYEFRNKQHFVWIKDLSRLVGRQLSKHKSKKYLCDGCLLYFYNQQKLEDHQKDSCHKVKITLPRNRKYYFFFFKLIKYIKNNEILLL